jgi:hypothetical protein
MINLVVPGWLSLTCWDGDLTIHTKRLRVETVKQKGKAMVNLITK